MARRSALGLCVLLALLCPRRVAAQTVYSDDGNHTINGASGPISVQNDGTTVTVVSGGAVTGGSMAVQNGFAIAGGLGTTVNLIGGSVMGGAGIETSGFFSSFGGSVVVSDPSSVPFSGPVPALRWAFLRGGVPLSQAVRFRGALALAPPLLEGRGRFWVGHSSVASRCRYRIVILGARGWLCRAPA